MVRSLEIISLLGLLPYPSSTYTLFFIRRDYKHCLTYTHNIHVLVHALFIWISRISQSRRHKPASPISEKGADVKKKRSWKQATRKIKLVQRHPSNRGRRINVIEYANSYMSLFSFVYYTPSALIAQT